MLKSEAAGDRAAFSAERDAARTEQDRLVAELGSARTHAEALAARTAELEAALDAHRALLHALQSVTNRRTSRRRSLSQLGTWLLPPTRRKLTYLRRYLALRRSGEFDVDSYLLANPDVLAAGINPLMHYVQYGIREGRPRKTGSGLDLGMRDRRLSEPERELNRVLAWNARLRSLLLDARDAGVSRDLPDSSPKALPTVRSGRRGLAACTIISRNYLSHARILARTYLEHEPDGRFYLLVVDGLPDIDPGPGIRVVAPAELRIPTFLEMCFKYNVVELSTAVKPSLLSLLLEGYGEERVVYLDPDMLVTAPLAEVHRDLADSALVLTPHILRPIPYDGRTPSEQDILISGAYNLGFLGVRRSAEVESFLAWWTDRLEDGCRIDVAGGLFTDQKWVDLVPGVVEGTAILRDETYNVAFWNLHERKIEREGETFLVNGRPLVLFHASGFDPGQRLVLSRHQNRTRVEPGTGLAELLDYYADLQLAHGYAECSGWGYGYSHFDNGISVNSLLRRLYLDLDEPARSRFGNPFATDGPESFLSWATAPTSEPPYLTPFLELLYHDRPDVAAAFPDVGENDREAFLEWARTQAVKELPFEPELVQGDVPNPLIVPAVSRPTTGSLRYEDPVGR